MKSLSLKLWLPLLLTLVMAGCAGTKQPLTFTPEGFPSGKYLAKAENFQIIMDASQTMANRGGGNFATAKNFVGAVNWTLPGDLVANGGLRTFGHHEMQSKKETELVYGMAKYSRDDLKKGLEKIKYAGGNSPLGAAINAASADLEKAAGNSVLVIVSDGTQNYMDDALVAAKNIKAKMGDKLCIYTVWIDDDPAGKKYLEEIAKAGGCGFAASAAALTDQKALAEWVEKVFLKPVPPPPPVAAPAPAPAPVVAPVPPPAPCKGVITANLTFDFDKAKIKPELIPVLQEAKKIIDECKTATYSVAGHTDSIGTDAYNQKLSERRAAAVVKWLVDNGVAADRLAGVGYGESQPKYDNKTKEGRGLNRRVEFINK